MHTKDDEPKIVTKSTWTTPMLMSTEISRETVFMGGPNGEAQGRPDS